MDDRRLLGTTFSMSPKRVDQISGFQGKVNAIEESTG
jgi:hypothetical protein